MVPHHKPTIGFGPERPGIGSWEWLGEDLAAELSPSYYITKFTDQIPVCDVLVLIKEFLPRVLDSAFQRNIPVIYCPVDCYGSSAEIDRDGPRLRLCDIIVLHCGELRKYFQSYAPVQVLEHHLRFVPPLVPQRKDTDELQILWVGHHSHVPLLVDYVNHHPLPGHLAVLTNGDDKDIKVRNPREFGFGPHVPVRVERWSPEAHRKAALEVDLAFDIKGTDFRQRHKPSAKALDFLASNLPLAINADSSPARHLKHLGFEVAAPDDHSRWLSEDYRQETAAFGRWLRETYSRARIGIQWRHVIDETLAQTHSLAGGHPR